MVNTAEIINKSKQYIWHPCTQMKDFEQSPPLVVHKAQGSYLYTDQGKVIDAISSWWCKSLGHGHPEVIAAINQQLSQFEHVIAANTTHPLLVELGEKLASISGKHHLFFASDGSTAVEIALKLAIHAKQLQGNSECNEVIALSNAYHGESIATLSVSDLGLYKKPYADFGLTCHFIKNIPYVLTRQDALWFNCDEAWQAILPHLEAVKKKVCAIIIEPLIQGVAGMRCYSANFLHRLAAWAKNNDIYMIADEIMTGMGRTGSWLASHQADINPDMVCLSKGLTGGTIPASCVLIDNSIYQLFYYDYELNRSFLHSNTFSANALAVSAALATIRVIEQENIMQQATELESIMHLLMKEIADITGKLTNVRAFGAIAAADLEGLPNGRTGFHLAQEAIKRGALLRPLGHTLYWLPPLNTKKEIIVNLAEITLNSIRAIYS